MYYACDPELDEMLALAYQDTFALAKVLDGYEPDSTASCKVVGASKMVAQWVKAAARKRGFCVHAEVGTRVPYDPVIYEFADRPLYGSVEILKPAIVQHSGGSMIVLVKGIVKP